MDIYEPSDDSYFLNLELKEFLSNKNKKIKILDMGTGSGIQAETCKKLGFVDVLAIDINKYAVKNIKNKGINSNVSDLFSNINKKEKFDLIIFNPPYLPDDKNEPKPSKLNTTGGKYGYEIIIKFLKQAKKFMNKNARILLLFSSLSHPEVILKKSRELGYNFILLNKKKLFFEELFVYELL